MSNLKISFAVQIVLIFISGCDTAKVDIDMPIGEPPIEYPLEEKPLLQEQIATERNDAEERYHYPVIESSSHGKLDLIARNWQATSILCAENEQFFALRKLETGESIDRFIAVSSVENTSPYQFYFYEFNESGKILSKMELKNADYSINNRYNFVQKGENLYYFTKSESRNEKKYTLESRKHSRSSDAGLNWDKILDWRSHQTFNSPEDSLSITILDATLTVTDIASGFKDSLIVQTYDGSWSFGSGVWNHDGTKFYFDNSGSIACIWELDLKNRTLDKIVPDHWADSPVYTRKGELDQIYYCDENCIKKTSIRKIEF